MGRTHDEALRRAILDYDLDEAERLLRADADPNVRIGEKRARSPYLNPSFAPNQFRGLHLAANDDDPELAALLLLHGANPHQRIYAGALPISIAAQAGHLKVAELLLHEYRREKGSLGYCPLRMAAYGEQLAMVELLLAKKPEEMHLHSALASAVARKGNLAVTERLLAAGAQADWLHSDRDPDEATTTRMVALQPQPEALPLLVGHGHVRLIDAAIDGDVAAVERFLRAGASPDDVDAHGYITALSAASQCGRTAVVRLLLERGATLGGPKGKADPLFAALRGGHAETADTLWAAGARTDRMLERAVLFTSMGGVRWALEQGGDADAALWHSIRVDRIDVARLALERGADASHRRHGQSVLMLAATRRPVDMVELLLAHGADLHATDRDGWTAMHHALFRMDDDPELGPAQPFDYPDSALDRPIVKLLAARGLPIPPRDRKGSSRQ